MRIKATVFGSYSERRLYRQIETAWADRFNVYHNLPLLNVLDVRKTEVSPGAWEFAKKTSLDITICKKGTDEPCLTIEFDGLGKGVSRDGVYFPYRNNLADPHRSRKLNQKVRWAVEAEYPMLVVSYPEAETDAMSLSRIAPKLISSASDHR